MITSTPRSDSIADALRRRIANGQPGPGERLPAIRRLCTQFNAGQATVEQAIAELAHAGIVQVRRRSGTYVTSRAPRLVAAETAPEPAALTAPAPESRDLLSYLQPRPRDAAVLTLYVSVLAPASLQLWRDVLDGFAGARVRLLSCHDGHLADLLQRERIDLMQTTPEVLQDLEPSRFVPYAALRERLGGDWEAELLPVVRERLDAGPDPLGVPFCLTLRYLFVNRRLEATLEAPPSATVDACDWLAGVVAAQRRLAARGADALTLPSLQDMLLLVGGLAWRPDRGVVLDLAAVERLFTLLHGSGLRCIRSNDVINRFASGRLLYAQHCSFEVPELLQRLDFDWETRPLPVAPDLRLPGWLTVLALNRDGASPATCGDLMSYLSTPSVQARFAAEHGNLPVLAGPAAQVAPSPGGELQPHRVAATLRQTSLRWHEADWRSPQAAVELNRLRFQLTEGSVSVADAMKTFRYVSGFTCATPV